MDLIKVEPCSFEETIESDHHQVDVKLESVEIITFPVFKSDDTEEPCDVTTIKVEGKEYIKAEEHNVHLDRSYSAEEVSLALATIKEVVKDEISTEEHEVSLDGTENFPIRAICDTASSAENFTECMESEWRRESVLSDTIAGSSFILPKYCDNDENRGQKCELQYTQSVCHKSNTTFTCEFCQKHFKHRRYLLAHICIQSGEIHFKCVVCNKSLNHVNPSRIYSGEKHLKCEVCNEGLSQDNNLVINSSNHTSVKGFQCVVCNKNFKRNDILETHSRIHTGEKPFNCEMCTRSFSRKDHLIVHSRIHTGEKPFKCKVCNERFIRSDKLKIHLRIHTGEKPFKCDVCNKYFKERRCLLNHSLIHTGAKPFKCEVCNKSFSRKDYLVAHSRIHTVVKPIK